MIISYYVFKIKCYGKRFYYLTKKGAYRYLFLGARGACGRDTFVWAASGSPHLILATG